MCIGLAVAVSVSSLPGEAQQVAKTGRVGYVGVNPGVNRERAAFLQGMRDLGYVEGRNIVIEYRFAQGDLARLPAITAELVALKVGVIVAAGGSLGALAARRATTTIPIVFPAVGDPVADGLVASLARPGGNATGLAVLNQELIGKRLELARQLVPHMSRAAFLLKPDAAPDSAMKGVLKSAEVAARGLGVRLQVVEARGPEDFERAFADMTRAGANVLSVHSTPAFDRERHRLVALALRHRLPTVYSFRHYVDAGGLISYGPDLPDLFRRAADRAFAYTI